MERPEVMSWLTAQVPKMHGCPGEETTGLLDNW